MTSTASIVDIRRADDRAKTKIAWLDSKHSFSFGDHYDPTNTHHGLLLVNNDDIVKPGTGFDTHPHRDMEIVTWVLRGSLVHQDSTGHSGVIYPGLAQRMSAGPRHPALGEERLLALTGDAIRATPQRASAFRADVGGARRSRASRPGYQQLEIDDELLRGGLVTIASGMPEHRDAAAITIRNRTPRCTARACSPATERRTAGGAVSAPVRPARRGRPRGRRPAARG